MLSVEGLERESLVVGKKGGRRPSTGGITEESSGLPRLGAQNNDILKPEDVRVSLKSSKLEPE